MNRKIVAVLIVLGLLGTVGMMLSTSQVKKTGLCDASISDRANVLGNQHIAKQDVALLQKGGADVRVITHPNIGQFASLDEIIANTQRNCRSWRDSSGNLKANLMVFALNARDHSAKVFVGSKWQSSLGDFQRIWSQFPATQYSGADLGTFFTAQIGATITSVIPGTPYKNIPSHNSKKTSVGWMVSVVVVATLGACVLAISIDAAKKRRAVELAHRANGTSVPTSV